MGALASGLAGAFLAGSGSGFPWSEVPSHVSASCFVSATSCFASFSTGFLSFSDASPKSAHPPPPASSFFSAGSGKAAQPAPVEDGPSASAQPPPPSPLVGCSLFVQALVVKEALRVTLLLQPQSLRRAVHFATAPPCQKTSS